MNSHRLLMILCLLVTAAGLPLGAGPSYAGPGGGAFYANSPQGVYTTGTGTGMVTHNTGTAMRKFVDSLPVLCPT